MNQAIIKIHLSFDSYFRFCNYSLYKSILYVSSQETALKYFLTFRHVCVFFAYMKYGQVQLNVSKIQLIPFTQAMRVILTPSVSHFRQKHGSFLFVFVFVLLFHLSSLLNMPSFSHQQHFPQTLLVVVVSYLVSQPTVCHPEICLL